MAKTVYSILLSSEIVEAVDRQAARQGLSRSALINHILADYASLTTPEARSRRVVDVAAQMAEQGGLRSGVTSGGVLTVSTAVRYKYNPALRYSVELFEDGADLGELRVTLRSQNQTLLEYMESFFQLFGKLESAHLPHPPPAGGGRIEQKRYTRTLRRAPGLDSEEELGAAIAAYIRMMDDCIHAFFGNLHNASDALRATEASYLRALSTLDKVTEF